MFRILVGILVASIALLWGAWEPAPKPKCAASRSKASERLLACMQLCYGDQSPLVDIGIPLQNLSSCLGSEDIDRQRCAALDEAAHHCLRVCTEEEHHFTANLPCATHPKLLRLGEAATSCSVANTTFDATAVEDGTSLALAAKALRECGAIFLSRVLDDELIKAAQASAEELLGDQERLLATYIQPHGTEQTDKDNLTQLPFLPNLRGGRFEVNLPSEPVFDAVVRSVAKGGAPRVLSSVWGAPPELLVALLMAQSNTTWNQDFHKDSDTTEEAKIQVAVQDYDHADGPPEFLLGSHLSAACRGLSQSNRMELFPVNLRSPVKAGDAILYFSGLDHRGVANKARRLRRASFDITIHSAGRFYFDSERLHVKDRPHVRDSAQTESMRAIWNQHRWK